MNENTTMLLTPVGSRLYGNYRADSDYDYYRVVKGRPRSTNPAAPKPTAHQVKKGDQDVTTVPFALWVKHAEEGLPLALDAMFSPLAEEDMLTGYRQGFHASVPKMRATYGRLIERFSKGETYKSRFHALRLVHNLNEAYETGGRYNPVLPEETRMTLGMFATFNDDRYFRYLWMLPLMDLSEAEYL